MKIRKAAQHFHDFIRDKFKNLVGMVEHTYPDAAGLSPGSFAGNYVTTSQPCYPLLDPSLLPPSNSYYVNPESNIAHGPAHQSTSRRQSQYRHPPTHVQYVNLASKDKSDANDQTVNPYSKKRKRRRSNRDAGAQADTLQGQPPKKKQRESRAPRNAVANSTTTGEAQEMSGLAKRDENLGGMNTRPWVERPNAEKIKQPIAAQIAVSREYLPPAGPPTSTHDTTQPRAGPYPSDGEVLSLNSWDAGTLANFDRHADISPETLHGSTFTNDSQQSTACRYPSGDDLPLLSPWQNSASAELGGHADTGHLPIPQFGFQQAPAWCNYNDGRPESENHGKRKLLGGSGLDNGAPLWSLSNLTGTPVSQMELKNTQEANHNVSYDYGQQRAATLLFRKQDQFGNQSMYSQRNHVLRPATYSPMASQEQPQSYGGQSYSNSVMADTDEFLDQTGIDTDTQNTLFSGGDFRYVLPKTEAEVDFIRSALDYTRAEYKSWMSVKPPDGSVLASYWHQYCEMQAHLEKMWYFPDLPPIKLRAIAPAFGGSGHWW